jgi:N-acetylglucosamine-6-sulfatase
VVFGGFTVRRTRERRKRMGNTARLLASMAAAMLLASGVVLFTVLGSARSLGAAVRPNIVLVVTDDLTKRDYFDLGNNLSSFTSGGTYFHNAFVTTTLCCPSRASTLTGLYAHNHHITQHTDPGTGYEQYHAEEYDQNDLPVWLRDSGYRTGLVGKYLNKYDAQSDGIPAGWTDWYGADTPTTNWTLNENGNSIRTYSQDPSAPGYEPWEDVMGEKAVEFVGKAHASHQPFFLWYGTHAPHSPELVAPQDENRVGTWPARETPSFNEQDVSDKPQWVADQPPLGATQQDDLEQKRQERLTSMLAVSRNLTRLKDELRETGELSNTYLILTSDNGYHLGQHRLGAGKMTVYDEDMRVPLAISGPGVASGEARQMVLNTDLAPTIADLAGITPGLAPDGRSFAPLLPEGRSGVATDQFRQRFMEENWKVPVPTPTGPEPSPAPTNFAIRGPSFIYDRYVTGETEYYDLSRDPYELEGKQVSGTRKENLDTKWTRLRNCRGAECRRVEGG